MHFAQKLFGMAAALAFVTGTASANLLSDAGFESGPLVDDGNGVGKWNPFADSGASTSDQSTLMPRTGAGHALLDLTAPNGFAGFFQDVTVAPGDELDWSVWAKDLTGTNGQGVEMRIEYRDSVANAEVSRTGNLVPASLSSDYELITLLDTAPAGADTARVVFAIQSFGVAPPQTVYVDDASVTVVPEPATAALLGLGGLAMLRRRSA